jgi:tetrahydromethanopterin S-methyltransferase subunit G
VSNGVDDDDARVADEARRRASEEEARARAEADRVAAEADRVVAEVLTGEAKEEGLRQLGVIYGGLIGVAVVMVQPFLAATTLDTSARVSVIAFAVAIPLAVRLGRRRAVGRTAGRPDRDRRRLLAHHVGRRGCVPRRRARGGGGPLGRLLARGDHPGRRVLARAEHDMTPVRPSYRR